ncbi:SDR family oxidoreductase [Cryobacterium fucosi]|uniref:SDR family oxidoreductase n=1 Tax=Cryobacterium fucosi TaxID=1259157 RepID=A0A4R9BFM8_9MICO|nr:SDR family oxidoreductase [Cryobacterium fucosi]TFD82775.1 SDR family oxidoreductase [Cryobacterium fucosi]
MNKPTVLIVGPYGVVGGAIARRMAADSAWDVITVSRRDATDGLNATQLSVDLLDPQALAGTEILSRVTHLVYAAYLERPTMAETTAPNLTMLAHTLDGLTAAGAPLEHVILTGGGKSYGEHLGAYKTPAKESDPRLLGPIFYNDQEDLLALRADRDGFTFTVLRPDVVIGFSLGSPMNLLNAIGVYASLSKAAGVPLRFPGTAGAWTALHQITDADLLASAVSWALTAESARGEIFNVTNGDQFRWQHIWDDIANAFDMPTAAPQPMSLAAQMFDKEPAWNALRAAHGLRPTPYEQLTSWEFADSLWAADFDMVQSTIKIRQAGFAGSLDSHHNIATKLRQLRRDKFLP